MGLICNGLPRLLSKHQNCHISQLQKGRLRCFNNGCYNLWPLPQPVIYVRTTFYLKLRHWQIEFPTWEESWQDLAGLQSRVPLCVLEDKTIGAFHWEEKLEDIFWPKNSGGEEKRLTTVLFWKDKKIRPLLNVRKVKTQCCQTEEIKTEDLFKFSEE